MTEKEPSESLAKRWTRKDFWIDGSAMGGDTVRCQRYLAAVLALAMYRKQRGALHQ